MTLKNTSNTAAMANETSMSVAATPAPITCVADLIEAQIAFTQQWLSKQAEPLAHEAWQWFGQQPMNRYVSSEDLQHLINDWLLAQPMSLVMRDDIRHILQALLYHPVNDNVSLSELVDETQIQTLATYISSHEQQRHALIHTLIGNDAFTDLLTQTLYHAINDFMENTLDKAGGVGKLMKMGRSSFEKATNRNLDEKLQTYLHRNIKDLAGKAETNAQAHLSNEEVSRLMITGWGRIKDKPVSQLQEYLDPDPKDGSVYHIEASLQQSYNRLRMTPYVHSLVGAGVETWYANHHSDTIASIATSLHIDESAIASLTKALLPIIQDAIGSEWLVAYIRSMLKNFFAQSNIEEALRFNP